MSVKPPSTTEFMDLFYCSNCKETQAETGGKPISFELGVAEIIANGHRVSFAQGYNRYSSESGKPIKVTVLTNISHFGTPHTCNPPPLTLDQRMQQLIEAEKAFEKKQGAHQQKPPMPQPIPRKPIVSASPPPKTYQDLNWGTRYAPTIKQLEALRAQDLETYARECTDETRICVSYVLGQPRPQQIEREIPGVTFTDGGAAVFKLEIKGKYIPHPSGAVSSQTPPSEAKVSQHDEQPQMENDDLPPVCLIQ